jgi:hypothetical protein
MPDITIEYLSESEHHGDWYAVSAGRFAALIPADGRDDNESRELAHRIGDVMARFDEEKG